MGMPVVGVPKTIDNDLEATAMTFGFDSAVACAPTRCVGRLAHDRGEPQSRDGPRGDGTLCRLDRRARRHCGRRDIILIPEIPFAYESICRKIAERESHGAAVHSRGGGGRSPRKRGRVVTQGGAAADRETGSAGGHNRGGGARPAHGQGDAGRCPRPLAAGGGPTAPIACCALVLAPGPSDVQEGKFGYMVALHPPDTVGVKITEAIGRPGDTVPVDGDIVQTARMLGISFGDE